LLDYVVHQQHCRIALRMSVCQRGHCSRDQSVPILNKRMAQIA
jgi:hypothetical protein